MEFIENRGRYMAEIKRKNTERVMDYYVKNPEATQKEVAEYLGISVKTVGRAVKHLRSVTR